MKTYTNLWDAMFGKRIELHVPNGRGGEKTISVTERWLEKMEREKRIAKVATSNSEDKSAALKEKATDIIGAAQVCAVASFNPLAEQFPAIGMLQQPNELENYDWVLTIAIVFATTENLVQQNLQPAEISSLIETVANGLQQWKPDGINGFMDCRNTFEKEASRLRGAGYPEEHLASDAIGMWIFVNLLSKMPQTQEDMRLLRTVGHIAMNSLSNWWGEK